MNGLIIVGLVIVALSVGMWIGSKLAEQDTYWLGVADQEDKDKRLVVQLTEELEELQERFQALNGYTLASRCNLCMRPMVANPDLLPQDLPVCRGHYGETD